MTPPAAGAAPRADEALRAAVARLRAAGIDDPARDARLLLAHALEVPNDRLLLHLGEPLGAVAAARFAEAVAARAARRPLAQIVGRRAFWGRDFLVTPDVLDPRPETETLVAAALDGPFCRVLDLGIGSGCILLSLLADRPDAQGLGVDSSEAALAIARRNAASLGVADRARFRLGDWCTGLTGDFDLVVANPPYLAAQELEGLAPEVRDWEPRAALSPGGDGLGAYRAIAAGLGQVMAPGCRLLLEIGPTQAAAVTAILRESGLSVAPPLPDLDGRARVISATPA